jgi:hypothetical protein
MVGRAGQPDAERVGDQRSQRATCPSWAARHVRGRPEMAPCAAVITARAFHPTTPRGERPSVTTADGVAARRFLRARPRTRRASPPARAARPAPSPRFGRAFGNAAFVLRSVVVPSGGGPRSLRLARASGARPRCSRSAPLPRHAADVPTPHAHAPAGPLSGIFSLLARGANPRVCLARHAPVYLLALPPHSEGLPLNRRSSRFCRRRPRAGTCTPPGSASSLPREASRLPRGR